MWQFRNKVRHDKSKVVDIEAHSLVDQEIEQIMVMVPPQRFLSVSERRLVGVPLEQVVNKPLKVKRKWIRDTRTIIKRFYDEKETASEVRQFRQYFGSKRARHGDEQQTTDVTKDGG
jgi:hypothetical protein